MKQSMGLRLSPRIPAQLAIRSFLYSGSVFFFGGLMLANVIAYAYQMLVSRVLSPGDYGVIVALTSIFDVLAVLMRTSQAWVIQAVAAPADPEAQYPRAVFMAAMRMLAPLGGIAFAALWLGSGWISAFLRMETTMPVILLGAYIVSSSVTSIVLGLLLGLNLPRLASLVVVVDPTARLAMGIALVTGGMGVDGAMVGFAVGNLACFGIALVALRPTLAPRRSLTPPVGSFADLDRYALLALVANTCLMIIVSIDQPMVKHFFSEQVAGNYAVAFLLGRIVGMSTIALGWVIFARSATMPMNDPSRRRLLIKALLATGLIAVTLAAGYLAVPGQFVQLLGGSQYTTARAYVGLMGVEMTLFALVYVQVYYHLAARNIQVVWPLVLATLLEVALLAQFHATVAQIQMSLIAVMGGLLIYVSGLSWRHFRALSHIRTHQGPAA